jgi:hypothetical protein
MTNVSTVRSRFIGLLAINLGFMMAWILWGALVAAGQARTVDGPEFRAGDTWAYKRADGGEYSIRVIEVGPAGSVTDSTRHPGARFYRDIHGAITKIEGALSEGSPKNVIGWKFLDFPLAPGKKFKYQVDGAVAPFSIEVKIEKWEKVSVSAGALRSFGLTRVTSMRRVGGTAAGCSFGTHLK